MKMPKMNMKNIFSSLKTRSFRVGGYSVAATAIVVAIAVAVNLLFSALPSTWTQFDATSNQMFSISDQTKKLVSSLDKEVTVYWIVRDGYEDAYIENLLDKYDDLGSNLKVVQKDPDVSPTFALQYTDNIVENSLVVVSGDRYRYIDYTNLYILDETAYYYESTTEYSFSGEQELTSAIDFVISEDIPKIYILSGHGESALTDTFSSALEDENVEVAECSLLTLECVPNDADCVLVNSPQSDISQDEKAKLEEYLGNGGNLILLTDPPMEDKLTNLEALMENYGVTTNEGIVVEQNQSYYAWGTPYYLLPEQNSHDITTPLREAGYYVMLPVAQGLTVRNDLPDGVAVTELLTTSSDSISKASGYNMTTYETEDGDLAGPFAVAVSITETLDDGLYSNILWVSSSLLLDENANSMVSGGNLDFFLNMVNYLCEPEGSSISIHAKTLTTEYLTMDSATAATLSLLMLAVIPVSYLAIGIFIWFRRKRR